MKKHALFLGVSAIVIGLLGSISHATTYRGEEVIPYHSYQPDELDISPVTPSKGIQTYGTSRAIIEKEYYSPYVTSIKNQNPFGTCWAFSFIAASEASLVKEGKASVGSDEIDLSELQLAYFLSHSVIDPLGGTAGDQFSIQDKSTNAFLNVGGNQRYATYRVANWYGLVNESAAPYASIVEDEEVVLSDQLAYSKDVFHLENAYWVSMQDSYNIKQMIMQYGACASAYYSADEYYSTGKESSFYETKEVAVYCPQDLGTNHGITIVGWDDSYSKDNFGTYKPSSNGAWYCKNSWGEEWSKDGYFWISYEDAALLNAVGFFYDFGDADNYENNYQYDGGALDAKSKYPCNYAANIYTAQGDEYINAVGFYTYDSNCDCTIEVFKNCEEGNPTSGITLAGKKIRQPYAGFHTVDLSPLGWVKKGERFSIVISYSYADEKKNYIYVDTTHSEDGEWCSNKSVSVAGQSFISGSGDAWQDISKDGMNCRIKAYTDARVPVTGIELNETQRSLYVDDTLQLTATVSPENADGKAVIWKSSDADIATVDALGRVTAKKAGKAIITCTSLDDQEVQTYCNIEVLQHVENITLDWSEKQMFRGTKIRMEPKIVPEDASNKNVTWTSSDEKVAVVSEDGTVTAVGYGTATITCTSEEQPQCSASCTVQILEKIQEITMNYETVTMKPDDKISLQVTTVPEIERTMGVFFASDNKDAVTVDAEGNVVAKLPCENVEIRCVAKDGTGVKAVCLVTVKLPEEEKPTEEPKEPEPITEYTDSASKVNYKVLDPNATVPTIAVESAKQCKGTVKIPKQIVVEGVKYQVVAIADNAFKGNKKITKVIVPDTITKIGKNAFYGCTKLSTVTIGKSVKQIGNKAFYKCKALKKITIKTTKLTKKKIGSKAFAKIHKKPVVKIPKKKWKTYRSMLKKAGMSKNTSYKKL